MDNQNHEEVKIEEKAAEKKKPEVKLSEEPKKQLTKVLVVNDNAILLRTVREMLNGLYDVQIAASGSQAFMAISKNIPDIILLDYEMPYQDGAKVLRKLRIMPEVRNVPVVFFTSSAEREVVTKLVCLNPNGYLLKPPNREKMIEKIEKTLKACKKDGKK